MVNSRIFTILLSCLFHSCQGGSLPTVQKNEESLITALLKGYNKSIRPEDQVSITLTTALQQIITIDEKQQIMTSSVFIAQYWYDDRLSWDINGTFNFSTVMLPVKSIWIPDTMILNSADSSGYLTISDYSFASIDSSGQVYMIIPALTIKTRCNFMVQKFPFDQQICGINLTSWAHGANRLLYEENASLVIDLSEYTEHPLWKLQKTDIIVFDSQDRVPFEDTYSSVLSIQLYLQRKPLFFILNGIFACLVLNCVTLLSFSLAFASQIGLCMICFMTYSVYSLNFSNLFPQQSQYIMMITLYFLLSICWTLLSMIWFIIYNYYVSKAEMPESFYAFAEILEKASADFSASLKKKWKGLKAKKDPSDNGISDTWAARLIKTGNIHRKRCNFCPPILTPCCPRPNTVDAVNNNRPADNSIAESNQANTTETKKAEAVVSPPKDQTGEQVKAKCNFCDRCKSCQAEYDKDKAKTKKKKDIEARANTLNYFFFACVFIGILTSNMGVWISMSQ